jgi:hypothetical protein
MRGRIPALLIMALFTVELASRPAEAQEPFVAFLQCDLITPAGPIARTLQFGSQLSGEPRFQLRLSIGPARIGPADVDGLACAQLLAELELEGLQVRRFSVVGRNLDVGLWELARIQP